MKYVILYNPFAGGGKGKTMAERASALLREHDVRVYDMTGIRNYADFFREKVTYSDILLLVGGDGTLNRFVNDTINLNVRNRIDLFPAGVGNDFARDLGFKEGELVENVQEYLTNLPKVNVNGVTCRFINGVGYGIDGYCCEVADRKRIESDKPVNYTKIAVLGVLFRYKPCEAEVFVNGEKHRFRRTWMASTMNGRYYGGGMMPTPKQNRKNDKHLVSLLIWHRSLRLNTLLSFSALFSGEHLKNRKMCELFTGNEITVRFSRPTALQVDGETVLGVTEYSVIS